MNRHLLQAGTLLLALLVAAPGWASDLSIVFVNTARLLEQAPQARQATERLEREFGPRDERLAALGKQLRELEERHARDAAILSDGERQRLEREFTARSREFQRAQAEFSEDLRARRSEEFDQLQRVAAETLAAVAREEGYDLVLDSGVAFASERVDITDRVLARMRQQASPRE